MAYVDSIVHVTFRLTSDLPLLVLRQANQTSYVFLHVLALPLLTVSALAMKPKTDSASKCNDKNIQSSDQSTIVNSPILH